MAYFRCSLGGGSGNGAVITVAYGAEFYNQTLTATNGVDTVSVVATSSGTVDIDVPSEGSWVISCTIGGDTYTSDPVAVDLSYETTLTALPDGKTVLPTDDIETWLKCAGITDLSYTTLSEVLADTDTYTTLLGDSNACDYMARSTTWADMTSQTGEVPTMTSNTTPSGVVSAGTDYDTNGAYKAFDGDDTTYWRGNTSVSQNGTATDYIQYQFATSKVVRSVLIKNTNTGTKVNFTSVTVSASNDGSTFTPLYTDAITMPSTEKRVSFENDTAYSYYRVTLSIKNISADAMRLPHVSTLQFYEEAEIPGNADAMRLLGMYDYACDALLSDSTWASAIVGSTYFESVLNVKVPVMTSNTAPSGEASASSSGSSYAPYKAFDGNQSTKWLASSNGDGWLQYEFASAIRLARVELFIAKSVTNTSEYLESITGANDGAETTIFDTRTLINSSSQNVTTILPITHSGSYKKIKLNLSIPSTVQAYVDEAQFYGRKPVQTDIIRSAPSDTIYYMDNGSPVTLCTTDTDGIGSVDWSDLPTGDITLYSSVAKDPDDLTADYSKSIKVTKNKVEAWLMPDKKVLYWYGWESNDLEDCTSANGWSWSGFSITAPTHQTNYINCAVSTKAFSYVAKKDTVGSGTVEKAVVEGVTAYNSIYGMVMNTTSKTITSSTISYENITSNSLALVSKTTSATTYVGVGVDIGTSASRASKVHALWLE